MLAQVCGARDPSASCTNIIDWVVEANVRPRAVSCSRNRNKRMDRPPVSSHIPKAACTLLGWMYFLSIWECLFGSMNGNDELLTRAAPRSR